MHLLKQKNIENVFHVKQVNPIFIKLLKKGK